MQEMQVQSLGGEDLLGKEMTTHSGILAWKIPRTEEPGRLQSMGWQRIRHDLATEQQLNNNKSSLRDRGKGVFYSENVITTVKHSWNEIVPIIHWKSYYKHLKS